MILIVIHSTILHLAMLMVLAMDDHFCRIRNISDGHAIEGPIYSKEKVA